MKLDPTLSAGRIHRGGSSGVTPPDVPPDDPPGDPPHPPGPPDPPSLTEGEDLLTSRLSHLDRMANWREAWNPRLSMSLASTKGLMNAPGDNNCFLNSAVQVLWHLDVFRRSFRQLSGHACMGNGCIFCALKVLFTQLQYSDRSTLPPDSLRRALASSFQDQLRFQLGHMDDAAECFENILTRIHFHIANEHPEDGCKARHCIPHQKFAMNIVEQILCQCGATTEPLPFTQMVHYVSANALVSQAKTLSCEEGMQAHPATHTAHTAERFAQLLRNATSEGDIRNCPSKCGEKVQIRRSLMNVPDVVSIGLIWDSDRPTLDHIKDVVRSIGTTIRLPDLFHGVSEAPRQAAPTLHLVGVVCYYGKHYSTFFFHSKMKKWVYFDDAHVKEMGPGWNNVAEKCCRGHYQPLLLLYANPDCEAVDTQTAPEVTTKLPGYTHFNSKPQQQGGVGGQPGHQNSRPRGDQPPPNRPYTTYETSVHRDAPHQNPKLRRSMTPGPEQHHHEANMIPRRAITPGPEYGRYESDEDETDAPAGVAHFRQSSYLRAVDGTPGAPGSGEKVHRSKTATHGGDPYYSGRREGFSQPPPQNGVHAKRPDHLYGVNGQQGYPVQGQMQGYPQGQPQGRPQGQPQGHSQGQPQGRPQGQPQGHQYQYVAPQTHPPQVAQKPKNVNGPPRGPNPQAPTGQQQKQVAQTEYQDWTLSTSESYRRQTMPKSPEPPRRKPETRLSSQDGTDSAGFVYPTSPAKTKNAAALAKVNEIQRLESFKKGRGKMGDVVRYQMSPDNPPTANPYGPLEPEAQYPGHESGVMQTSKNGQQNVNIRMPNSQSHPALKSEAVQAAHHSQPHQPQAGHSNLKRTRSLENTVQQQPQHPQHHGEPVPHPAAHGGAVTTGRTRPQSARPFENGTNPPPPTTPKMGPKRAANAYPSQQQGVPTHPGVEGKPPRPSSSRGQGYGNEVEEDPYGTLQYINRRAVESVLTYQHKKPGSSGTSRVRTLSQGGPGSVGSRSSNSSLESATEQLARTAGQAGLPPRPALPEALRVEIPGDNISIGSHKDSGYRSGSSGAGDRNSASSMSSVSVDSPGSNHLPHHQVVGHKGLNTHHPHMQGHQQQGTLAYANPETKSHSSTDSLSSGQSGQSYATVRAGHGHQPIPQQQQQQQHQRQPQQQQMPAHHYQQQQQQQHHQNQPQQYQNHPQYQNQHQPRGSTTTGQRSSSVPRASTTSDDPQMTSYQAESLMEQSGQKEKEGDLSAAMLLCTQAIGCLQQAMSSPVANSDLKAHLRMKYNTFLLRSRALQQRLTSRNDSVNNSDVSGEDHTSISSQSTDGDVRDLIDSPQHRNPGYPYQNQQPYHHPGPQQGAVVPGSSMYEQQYSSDSGYSSHSMEVPHPHHHQHPQQKQHHGYNQQMPHSYTDGAIADQKQVDNNGRRDWANQPPHGHHKQSFEDVESNTKSIELYATLPRKRAPKTKMMPAMPVRDKKEAEVYQLYLQRQKEATQQRQQEGSHPQQSFAQQQPQQQQGQHSRQTSNSGKMNKEQIKHLLIHDFMARKEGKVKDDQSGIPVQQDQNPEHHRIRNMLSNELSHQMKGVSVKDTKRAQSVMNLHQVDTSPEYNHPSYAHHPHHQQTEYAQHQPDHPARGYMVHPDSLPSDMSRVQHSRESSCSSTTTLRAHSRENSLSSPPLSPKQSAMYAPAATENPSRHSPAPPAWCRGPQASSADVDRDVNPPKPSMISKMEKMHQQQAAQQQWMHQPGTGWQNPGAPPKTNMRKSVSHTQLPMFDGHADWTNGSEGDVWHTEGSTAAPITSPGETTATNPAESTTTPHPTQMTTPYCPGDQEEIFPPPPPELLQDDEQFPPPPPELLMPYEPEPEPMAAKPPTKSGKPRPPPKPGAKSKRSQPSRSAPVSPPLPPPPPEAFETETTEPTNKKNSSVGSLVANFEANTMTIQKKASHVKMKPQQNNCTFSTFFAPPDEPNSGDRSSLSSMDSSCVSNQSRTFESDSSCQTSTGSNFSNTDGEPGEYRKQPRRPRSAMKKKKEGRPRRKSVSFSDSVALVVDKEALAESQSIDYIQYVSKVLEQSKRRKAGQNHDRNELKPPLVSGGVKELPAPVDGEPPFHNGYDSDFDEDSGSSASSTDGGDAAQTRCNLCSKKVVEVDEIYCANCKFYMSQFQPTTAPSTNPGAS